MAEYSEKNKFQPTVPNLQASFALLNKYRNQTRRVQTKHLQMEKRNGVCSEETANALNSQVLSAVTIMKMAEMVLSQSESFKTGDFCNLAKSFGIESCISRRSENHLKHVLRLLDAAEKFSNEEYDEAEELLVSVLAPGAHPIERVITCYAGLLRERIDVKKCRIDLEREVKHVDLQEAIIDLTAVILACEQKLPINQISNFAAIQTILDSLESAERIHFIDIGRKLGSYWIVMMHALANQENSKLKQLKITAVCTPIHNVEKAGELLSSFAESVNLPFVFKILYIAKNELEKVRFEYEDGETVAVFMDHSLHCLSACPKNVEGLLRGLKSLNPRVMVVIDVEENFTPPTFISRFRGSLFVSSAVLDCLESCLEGERHFISVIEKLHFQETICNGVLSDNDGSFSHHRRIGFWRKHFSKFGILEMELSEASICQARLMIREGPCWSSCSLSMNGKSMILCWKGIPLQFLSAWKF